MSAISVEQHIKLITEIRKELWMHGWKVQDLALATGYSVRTMYRLLNARIPPSDDCIYEVTRCLGINLEDFDYDPYS